MNLMAIGRYRNANAANPRGGYQEPFTLTTLIIDHRDGHYVSSNRVAFKYPHFKKDTNPDVHVRVFNYVIKENVKTFKEYIINAFSYMLRDWHRTGAIITCQNFLTIFFWSLHKHFTNVIGRLKMMNKYTWS
jgi:hypothetical protein